MNEITHQNGLARRRFVGLSLGAMAQLFGAGSSPLRITSVEPVVIRTPQSEQRPEHFVEMAPLGSMSGGKGLWNRIDHASPSRTKGATQATLVKITTDQGIVGWGERQLAGVARAQLPDVARRAGDALPKHLPGRRQGPRSDVRTTNRADGAAKANFGAAGPVARKANLTDRLCAAESMTYCRFTPGTSD